jgi:two-component system, NtrC family, sensor kinase
MATRLKLARRLLWAALFAGIVPAFAAALLLLDIQGDSGAATSQSTAIPLVAVGLCAIAILGGVWIALMGWRISTTLRALNRQAEAMARGDLTGRVEPPGRRLGQGCRDELDQVATALNLLTAQLAQQITERDRYEGDLRALNAELEHRIDERTRDLEEAQRQIVRAEKRSALGQLVAGIAHEINNHVNFITSATGPIEMGAEDLRTALLAWHRVEEAPEEQRGDRIREAQATEEQIEIPQVREELDTALSQMRQGAQRIRSIVSNLRTFSHCGDDRPERVDLIALIEQTLFLVKPRLSKGIEVRTNLQPLPIVQCLAHQMSQVLVNLLINAGDAMGEEGRITLRAWRERDEVHLSVEDTGDGIPVEIQSRIFDPFFTTKDVGEGTGLGLYVCQQILEEHGGGIRVESIPGEGTAFTLHWPAHFEECAKLPA